LGGWVKPVKWAALPLILALSAAIAAYLAASHLIPTRTETVTVTITEAITEGRGAGVEDDYRKAAQELLQRVAVWVERERGLELRENVSLEVLTREWVLEHWGAGLLNLTEVRIQETLLKALLMIPPEFNLTRFKIDLSGYTVAASSGNTIYVVREYFDPYDELRAGSTLAHELMHVLQGEYFQLPEAGSTDEKSAQLAVIEGEANLLGSLYFISHGGGARSTTSEASLDPLDALWYFPYMCGESFVRYVYERGGWDGVNRLYGDPPRSTAEILHPDKYLRGWRPVRIQFSEDAGLNLTLILRDTLGEFFIRQMLRRHLSPLEANQSAEGWRGDVLELYEGRGRIFLRWRLVWESERDAAEFLESFTRILEKAGATRVSDDTWRLDGRVVTIVMRGDRVDVEMTWKMA